MAVQSKPVVHTYRQTLLTTTFLTRLHLQHLWTQLRCGYLIHPGILLAPNAKIADIATWTGYVCILLMPSFLPSFTLSHYIPHANNLIS
jgi:hypothetical protein